MQEKILAAEVVEEMTKYKMMEKKWGRTNEVKGAQLWDPQLSLTFLMFSVSF